MAEKDDCAGSRLHEHIRISALLVEANFGCDRMQDFADERT